jgi:hypothetical protein
MMGYLAILYFLAIEKVDLTMWISGELSNVRVRTTSSLLQLPALDKPCSRGGSDEIYQECRTAVSHGSGLECTASFDAGFLHL